MSPLDEVAEADAAVRVARQQLQDAVDAAREQGVSWAAIGARLGITRQAAFKRFGSPTDPRTGTVMTPRSTGHLPGLVESVFRSIDAGDYAWVAGLLAPDAGAVLTREVVLGTWSRAVAETGNLLVVRTVVLELPDGDRIVEGDAVTGTVIGSAVLECEAGRWVGRVAVDGEDRITGLLVAPPGATDLPF